MSMAVLHRTLMGAAVCLLAPALAGAAEPNAALSYWKAFHFIPRMNQNEIKVVSEWRTAKLEDLRPLVEGTPWWLTFLHRGAKIKECSWGQDYDEDGIHHLLPHLDKGRMLTRLALAKARSRFEQADTEGGLEDALAVLALARHMGRDEVTISYLVQLVTEQDAIELIAKHLPALSAEQRKRLIAGLDGLPKGGSRAGAMKQEKNLTTTWFLRKLESMKGDAPAIWKEKVTKALGGDFYADDKERKKQIEALLGDKGDSVEKLIALSTDLVKTQDELIKMTELSPDKVGKPVPQMLDKAAKSNPLGPLFLPGANITIVWDRSVGGEARIAMLKAAVAVLGGSADDRKTYLDPAGGGPFTYRKAPGGFELQSKQTEKDKPVVVRVGMAPVKD